MALELCRRKGICLAIFLLAGQSEYTSMLTEYMSTLGIPCEHPKVLRQFLICSRTKPEFSIVLGEHVTGLHRGVLGVSNMFSERAVCHIQAVSQTTGINGLSSGRDSVFLYVRAFQKWLVFPWIKSNKASPRN